MNNENLRKSFFSEWLEKLQQESWQLELIISGFALYGVYNAKSLLIDIDFWKATHETPWILKFVDGIPETGWKIFFINLLVHVILRALWIGAIGLRYVSSEINYDRLNYSSYLTDYLRRKVGDYDDFIERLEKLCSVLFSYTFLLFLMAVSFSLLMAWSFLPYAFLDLDNMMDNLGVAAIIGIWLMLFWLFGLVVLIDFVTGGRLKKIKNDTFTRIYFYIFQFYSILSLSIFYRPLLYNFLDSKYTRRFFYFSFVYIFIINSADKFIAFGSSEFNPIHTHSTTSAQVYDPNWYTDTYFQRLSSLGEYDRKAYFIDHRTPVRLSTYHVKDDMAEVFLRISDRESDRVLAGYYNKEKRFKKGFRFFWQDDDIESSFLLQSLDSFDHIVERINNERSLLRMARREIEQGDPMRDIKQAQLDSLTALRKQIYDLKASWKKDYDIKKMDEALADYRTLFDLKIDDTDINDSLQCVFYKDPFTYDQGLLCHLRITHLAPGHHRLIVNNAAHFDGRKGALKKKEYVLGFLR